MLTGILTRNSNARLYYVDVGCGSPRDACKGPGAQWHTRVTPQARLTLLHQVGQLSLSDDPRLRARRTAELRAPAVSMA